MGARPAALALVLALAGLTLWAPAASATFHLMLVREVYPGSTANPGSEYVELQMYAAGQNLVATHTITTYTAGGAISGETTFSADVPQGANQSTILAATPAAESEFGVVADTGMTPNQLDPAAGAVCWETIDCVAWGSFSGSLPAPAGQPAATGGGIPAGMALRRTIAPNCPTLLEAADDSDGSALDFSAVFPKPRPNSVAPSEHACSAAGGGGPGGPGPGSTRGAPRTRIVRGPGKLTRDRTPTFRFASSPPGSTFLCKLDRHRFRRCRSPFTTRRLRFGRHVFKVKARGPNGALDPSPARYRFTVARHQPHRLWRPMGRSAQGGTTAR